MRKNYTTSTDSRDHLPHDAEAQRDRFLRALFENARGFLDVRLIQPGGKVERIPVEAIDETLKLLAHHAERGLNTYVGVATRRTCSLAAKAGGSENLLEVHALWIDFDLDPESPEGAREAFDMALDDLAKPPSMLVSTGGGFHAYWFLDDAVDLAVVEDRGRFENVLKGLADTLHADFRATDAARILRVPGTLNYPDAKKRKQGRKIAACELLRVEPDRRYGFSDFAALEQRGAELRRERAEPAGYTCAEWNGGLPSGVAALLDRRPKVRARWEGSTKGLRDESDSGLDLAIADLLAREGIPGAEIEHALRFRRAQAGAKSKHAGYFADTVGRAVAWAGQQQVQDAYAKAPSKAQDGESEETEFEDGTDDGLGERFVRLHGQDVIYVPTFRRWYAWDGTRYARDDGNSARSLMRDSLRSLLREAADEPKAKRQDELAQIARKARSMPRLRGALFYAECDPRIVVQPDALDQDPWLLNVKNGTLDLRTGQLHPHCRSDRLTRCVPVEYDPSADATQWLKFLERVQEYAEMRSFLQRVTGYALTGLTTEELLIIFYGGGANGKSTFLETVRAMFGRDYAAELASSALTFRRYGDELERMLAPLPGIRFATSIELHEGQRLHEQAIKKLTSGEPLRARCLYAESFEFTPICTLFLATNHRPTVTGDDDAIWRRLGLVPWTVQIPEGERDRDLREKLRQELPGVLRWAVEGCLEWQRQGLDIPKTVAEATTEYRSAEDTFGAFLDECCEKKESAFVRSADLRAAWEGWCDAQGVSARMSPKAMADRLRRRGFQPEKKSGARGWLGLDLCPEGWARIDEKRRK